MKEAQVLQRKPEPRDLAMTFQRQGKEQKKHIILERAEILSQIHLKRNQNTPLLVSKKVHLQNFVTVMSFILKGELIVMITKI